MRHIAALSDDKIPRNSEFNFLTRAQTLVDKWHEILNSKKNEGSNEGKAESKPETTNGGVDSGAMDVDAAAVTVEATA